MPLLVVEYSNSVHLSTLKDKKYHNCLNLPPHPPKKRIIAFAVNRIPYLKDTGLNFLPADFGAVMLTECCILPFTNIERAKALSV